MIKEIKWNLTWRCNLNCIHCLVADRMKVSKMELKFKEVIRVINYLKDNNRVDMFHFIGGEPLCHPHFAEIYEYCQYLHIPVKITTNGSLIDENMAEFLVNTTTTPHSVIGFSLDGPTNESNDYIRGDGVFDSCIAAVEKICYYKKKRLIPIKIFISATINKGNINILEKYIDIIDRFHLDGISLSPIRLEGNAMGNSSKLSVDHESEVYGIKSLVAYKKNRKFQLLVSLPPKLLNNIIQKNFEILQNECSVINKGMMIFPDGSYSFCDNQLFLDAFCRDYCDNISRNILDGIDDDLLKKMKLFICKSKEINANKINCIYSSLCAGCYLGKRTDCSLCGEI